MFDIGFAELLLCAIVALLVLGPERLPGAARTVGRWVGRARRTVNHFTEQIDREIRAEELKRRIEEEMRKAGLDDVSRQVNEALRAPLDLEKGDTPRIAPPVADHPDVAPALRDARQSLPAAATDGPTTAMPPPPANPPDKPA